MNDPPRILIVDDNEANRDILDTRLKAHGYVTLQAVDGEEALVATRQHLPDLILLDVMMPKLGGIEVCRRIKGDASLPFTPVILVTAKSDTQDVVAGLDAGADEYLAKPIDQAALVARVRSMLRVKALQDELKDVNAKLAERVRDQVAQLERLSRLKRFFSPQVADAIVAGGEEILKPHRREITAVFLDLRGFTAFTDRADPEEVLDLLRAYHATLGRTVEEFGGTLEHFAGDGARGHLNQAVSRGTAREAVRLNWRPLS